MTEKKKPIIEIDLLPTPDSFGLIGFISFLIAYALIMAVFFQTMDLWLFIFLNFLFIAGGIAGRSIESSHHQKVMRHMTPKFQKQYKDIERALAEYEQELAKKRMDKKNND